jgi:hypothetical protein
MSMRRNSEPNERHFQRGGVAAATALALLPLGRTMLLWGSAKPSKDLTRLTAQRTAQFIQDVRTIHSGAIVVQPEQSRVGHTRLFLQAINRPILLVEDFSKLAHDHGRNLSGSNSICQLKHIYEVYFTYYECRSKVAPRPRGPHALSVQWKTSANLRAGDLRTFPGLPSSADGGRT